MSENSVFCTFGSLYTRRSLAALLCSFWTGFVSGWVSCAPLGSCRAHPSSACCQLCAEVPAQLLRSTLGWKSQSIFVTHQPPQNTKNKKRNEKKETFFSSSWEELLSDSRRSFSCLRYFCSWKCSLLKSRQC